MKTHVNLYLAALFWVEKFQVKVLDWFLISFLIHLRSRKAYKQYKHFLIPLLQMYMNIIHSLNIKYLKLDSRMHFD